MRRFSENEYVDVYLDYDHKLYIPTQDKNGVSYVLEPKTDDGEILYTSMQWRDVRVVCAKSSVFKTGKVRFEASIEEDALRQLKIDPIADKTYYTRDQIEYMITNPSDEVLKEIISIKDKDTLEKFLSIYIGLKNTNEYFLADKVEMYIRARIEEINEGVRQSEFDVTPTKNEAVAIETAVIEENDIEEVETPVEPKKTTGKKTASRTKSNTKKSTDKKTT